jgi:putative hemolysin
VGHVWLNIAVVALFILIGSLFVATEIAFLSLRESQVRRLEESGGRRGRQVARLSHDPNLFLAAAQIGVTFAGFLSAALGGATLEGELSPYFVDWGLSPGVAEFLSLLLITMVISYFSLVIGELVPKRLALQSAERIALTSAPALNAWSRLMRPVIALLSWSTNLVVRILGGDPKAARGEMTEEELRTIVVSHSELDAEEREILDEVFSMNETQLREIMVPRTEVDFIDAATPVLRAARQVAGMPHSRYPVAKGSPDEIVGFVHVRDLLDLALKGSNERVGEVTRDVMMLPGTKPALTALTEMRQAGQHLVVVVDEYGGTDGIVTLEDLVEELVGDIRDEYDLASPEITRQGSTVEVDGLLNLEDFTDETGLELPDGPYETVAGFVVRELGRVPREGDVVRVDGHELVVASVEGRRAARIRVTPSVTTPVPDQPADDDHEPAPEHPGDDPDGPRPASESAGGR